MAATHDKDRTRGARAESEARHAQTSAGRSRLNDHPHNEPSAAEKSQMTGQRGYPATD